MRLARLCAVAGAVVICSAAFALPAFDKLVVETYGVKKDSAVEKAGCALCHAGKTNFKKYNLFGTDLKKAMAQAKSKALTVDILKKIELVDSDKDGVKNGDEIKADTLPGDPKSK